MNPFILDITVVLLAGIAASKIAERIKISDVILLLALGVIVGPEALGFLPESQINAVGETIRELALIIIVFDAGYHLSWRILRKEWFEVTKYVTVGIVFVMAIAAVFAHALFGMPYALAFLFGAVVAVTDPSATLSILRGVKIPPKVKDTLEAESIANDPTGIILTYTVLGIATSGTGLGSIKYGALLWMLAISIVFGVAAGKLSGAAMVRYVKDYSVLFSVSAATATYMIADAIGGSGIFSAAIAGAVLGREKIPNKRTIIRFDDELATLMKIGIFVYLGAIIKFGPVEAVLLPGILFALLLVFVLRPAMILTFASPKRFTLKERLYMGLMGPVAVVPAALAPLFLQFPGGDNIVGAIFTVIAISLIVVGGLMKYYNRKLLGVKGEVSLSKKLK